MTPDNKRQYIARFIGCTHGAIGKHYRITARVTGANLEDARLNLYARFDHIEDLHLEEIDDHEPPGR